jgi:hypothetical protein
LKKGPENSGPFFVASNFMLAGLSSPLSLKSRPKSTSKENRHLTLEDLEIHFDCQLDFDGLSVFGGGFEFVLANGFYGLFVESHAYSPGNVDV